MNGRDLEPNIAQGLALGDIHPETMLPIEDLWPDFKPATKKAAKFRDDATRVNTIMVGRRFD